MDLIAPASSNPSSATMDEILRDANAFANAGINGVGQVANAGVNLYNTMANAFSNPQNFMGQMNQNPYSANMGYQYQMPQQVPYAYAENVNTGYGLPSYLNTMSPQMSQGYPGFADPDYGNPVPTFTGFGFGGKL